MRQLPLVLAVLGAACNPTVNSGSYDAARIVDGSPEAVGVLGFLNHHSATFVVLDQKAGLETRAAGNLVAHRDGGDRMLGTTDDDLFDDMEEVDAVRHVGEGQIRRLASYAALEGWVPEGDDYLGLFDGVSFTVTEAELTTRLANTASEDLLDHDLGLDSRAVSSILYNRPLYSVGQLADCYYVGESAMKHLKEVAVSDRTVTTVSAVRFTNDLAEAVAISYQDRARDYEAMGAASLEEALRGISPRAAWPVVDAEDDPLGHDLSSTLVWAHPDMVFPGSDRMWFGAYDRASGALLDVAVFE